MKKSVYITILITVLAIVLFGACLFLLIKDNTVLPVTDGAETLAESGTPTVTDPAGKDPTTMDFWGSVPYYSEGNLPLDLLGYDPEYVSADFAYPEGVTSGCYFIKTGKLTSYEYNGSETLKFPHWYNDGTHGILPVSYIKDASTATGLLQGNTIVKKVDLGRIEKIGKYFAYQNTTVTSVIGDKLWHVGGYAFYGSSNLLNFPFSNLKVIGNHTFQNATSLTELTFSKISTIYDEAFYGCTSLTTLNFPIDNTVSSIGKKCFAGCSNLEGDVVINGNGSATIGEEAFKAIKFSKVELYGVSTIKTAAFASNYSLKEFVIGEEVTTIETEAFDSCGNVELIQYNSINLTTFPSSATVCPFWAGMGAGAEECVLNIGPSVKSIPSSFMYNNYKKMDEDWACGVTQITFSDGVNPEFTIIPKNAFYGQHKLKIVNIPESITTINSSAFQGCGNLTTVNFNAINCNESVGSNIFYDAGEYADDGITLNVGLNVSLIPSKLFYVDSTEHTPNLTTVHILSNDTIICKQAFYQCKNLANVYFPDATTIWIRTIYINDTSGYNINIADSGQNAIWLRSTSGYYNRYWKSKPTV